MSVFMQLIYVGHAIAPIVLAQQVWIFLALTNFAIALSFCVRPVSVPLYFVFHFCNCGPPLPMLCEPCIAPGLHSGRIIPLPPNFQLLLLLCLAHGLTHGLEQLPWPFASLALPLDFSALAQAAAPLFAATFLRMRNVSAPIFFAQLALA